MPTAPDYGPPWPLRGSQCEYGASGESSGGRRRDGSAAAAGRAGDIADEAGVLEGANMLQATPAEAAAQEQLGVAGGGDLGEGAEAGAEQRIGAEVRDGLGPGPALAARFGHRAECVVLQVDEPRPGHRRARARKAPVGPHGTAPQRFGGSTSRLVMAYTHASSRSGDVPLMGVQDVSWSSSSPKAWQ